MALPIKLKVWCREAFLAGRASGYGVVDSPESLKARERAFDVWWAEKYGRDLPGTAVQLFDLERKLHPEAPDTDFEETLRVSFTEPTIRSPGPSSRSVVKPIARLKRG